MLDSDFKIGKGTALGRCGSMLYVEYLSLLQPETISDFETNRIQDRGKSKIESKANLKSNPFCSPLRHQTHSHIGMYRFQSDSALSDIPQPCALNAVSGILAPKITSSRASFEIRSGSVRDPFGIRSGSVRAPFGSKFRSQKF